MRVLDKARMHIKLINSYRKGRRPWSWCDICGVDTGNYNPWRLKFICSHCKGFRK